MVRPATAEQYGAMLHALLEHHLHTGAMEDPTGKIREVLDLASPRLREASALLRRAMTPEGPSDGDKVAMGALILDTVLPTPHSTAAAAAGEQGEP